MVTSVSMLLLLMVLLVIGVNLRVHQTLVQMVVFAAKMEMINGIAIALILDTAGITVLLVSGNVNNLM